MSSVLEDRFREQEELYPHHSSIIVFGRAVKGQRYRKEIIEKAFIKLVEKEDYSRGQKEEIIDYMLELSHS